MTYGRNGVAHLDPDPQEGLYTQITQTAGFPTNQQVGVGHMTQALCGRASSLNHVFPLKSYVKLFGGDAGVADSTPAPLV